jgi:TolB-like protein/tetratricopeptide (TPR) repeat protein
VSTDIREQDSYWQKLRRRKVVQWGIAYAAGAWGFLQGLEYVSDTFGWPAQYQQFATIGLALGLPIVLVIAWYHGDRGQQRVTAAELTIITLLFLVGGGIFWRYDHRPETAETLPSTTEPAAPGPAPTVAAPADASVAVLPFANMSDEPGTEYFSDGLAEEILNALAQVPDLRVPSRTSSFSFRGQQTNLRSVAETLQVAHVLEGSVRRDGQRIRVTAQLIDARTDSHLWSKTWDRQLRDVFQVQQEIAGEIAKSLEVQFGGPGNQPRSVGTDNVEAYELYLQARHFWRQRGEGPLRESMRLFEEAIRLDPGFARAHSGLAAATGVLVAYTGPEVDAEALGRAAETHALRALSLDPSLAEAHAVLAANLEISWKFAAAEAEFQRAIALDPADSTAQQWYAEFLLRMSRFREAAKYFSRALELDPLSPAVNLSAAYNAISMDLDVETCTRLAQRSADLGFGQRALDAVATCNFLGGDPERARSFLPEGSAQALVLDAIMDPAKKPAALQALKDASAGGSRAPSVFETQVTAYIYLGEIELAFEAARRAIEDRSFWGPDVLAADRSPYMQQFRADPRLEQLLRDAGLVDYWRSAGWADLCRPEGEHVVCKQN